jgi:manganese/zinc/iron transport system permease protein
MIHYNTLVVLCGVSLLAAAAGLVGVFAILRRRALTGDALAHASFPGICIAFMLTGERRLPVLLAGAFIAGIAGNATLSAMRRFTRLREDAALGTVLAVFFGAGLVLSRVIQNSYHEGNKAGLDSFLLGKTAGMTRGDLYWIAGLAAACLATVLLCYKEFKLTSFDGDFASTLGWPIYRLDQLMMGLIAVAVVIGLPAVGVVMIASLLILPGASARFWTERLSIMLFLAGVFGLGIGLVGTLASTYFALLPAGPIIVLTGTALFVFSLLCGTKRGLVARWLLYRRFREDWEERQLLNVLYECCSAESKFRFTSAEIVNRKAWSPPKVSSLITRGIYDGLMEPSGAGAYQLTEFGRRRSLEVARGNRLWEMFLKENPEQAGSVVNLAEESVTNVLPAETVAGLTRKLQEEGRWPA